MTSNPDYDWLQNLLSEVDLLNIYEPLVLKLGITELSHFDHVKKQDFESINLPKPSRRRLFEKLKEYRKKYKNVVLTPVNVSKVKENLSDKSLLEGNSHDSNSRSSRRGTSLRSNASNAAGTSGLIQDNELKLIEQVGDGFSGVVFKAKWTRSAKEKLTVAVKTLKTEKEDMSEFNNFMQEVNLMLPLQHPHLVRLYGIVLSLPIKMITEFANLGCLRVQLLAHYPTVLKLQKFSRQLASACVYLSEKLFIHRDIAARNVLLFDENTVKLGDFGLMCKRQPDNKIYIMQDRRRIPLAWSAPESLAKKEFSEKSDVYMFGVLLWEIFDRCSDPWPKMYGKEILSFLKNGGRLHLPKFGNNKICSLIEKCWLIEPIRRPSFAEIYETFKTDLFEVQTAVNDYRAVQSGQCLVIMKGDKIAVIKGSSWGVEFFCG